MLESVRMSHQLAHKSVKCLNEAGYQAIEILQNSSWDERTRVLTKGRYSHYRDKTATALGDLADFMNDKYGKYGFFDCCVIHEYSDDKGPAPRQ